MDPMENFIIKGEIEMLDFIFSKEFNLPIDIQEFIENIPDDVQEKVKESLYSTFPDNFF